MNFSLAGTGNVAHHICLMLKMQGHQLHQVYARNTEKGTEFCQEHGGSLILSPQDFSPSNHFIFIATSDSGIHEISKSIDPSILTVHFSGNSTLDVLIQHRKAVLWPVFSFSKTKQIDYAEIPFVLEPSDLVTAMEIENIMRMVSKKIFYAGLEDRKKIHLAAVFANNFTTRLYEIAQSIARETTLPAEMLQPMITDLVKQLSLIPAEQLQTGPARRADFNTLRTHIAMLDNREDYKKIYTVITNSILKKYHGTEL